LAGLILRVAQIGGGEHEHGNRSRRRVLFQQPDQLEAIGARHEPVGDDEIGLELPGLGEAVEAIGGGVDFVMFALEDGAKNGERDGAVVNDQYARTWSVFDDGILAGWTRSIARDRE